MSNTYELLNSWTYGYNYGKVDIMYNALTMSLEKVSDGIKIFFGNQLLAKVETVTHNGKDIFYVTYPEKEITENGNIITNRKITVNSVNQLLTGLGLLMRIRRDNYHQCAG